jgi:hypothetical protein
MKRARAMGRLAVRAALAGLLACVAGAAACSSSSATSGAGASCLTNADCSGGAVCGFANAGGDSPCTAHGVCVTPVNEQPTSLCGCGGGSIQLVVDDVDAGVYYWSGVIAGEMGFPPCGDTAIAPSSNVDATVDAPEETPAVDAMVDAPADAGTDASAGMDAPADGVADAVADAVTDVSAQ